MTMILVRVSLADIGTSENQPRGAWSRSPRVRAVVAAALAVSLLLGGAFLVVHKLHPPVADALDHPDNPITDEQSKAQVIEPARQIVGLNGLQTTSAGYLLMSCKNDADPPYQGAVYLTFTLPDPAHADTYFPTVAATLVNHGWTEGVEPNNRVYGRTLSKDSITAVLYRHNDDPRLGIVRLYGECRNLSNHLADGTGWVDVTGDLRRSG
jgi:hypothetical protein